MELSNEAEKQRERYLAAAHAMQSAVAYAMHIDESQTSPKHLRVGVNSAMVEFGALVSLLVEKGIVTNEEFFARLADHMEAEVDSYKSRYFADANVRFS